MLIAGLWMLAIRVTFLQRAAATTGTITGYETLSQSTRSARSYVTFFSYTTSEHRTLTIREANATADHTPLRREGTTIYVLYDPADPRNAIEDRWSALWTVPATLLGVGMLLLLSTYFRLRSSRVEHALARAH